MELIASCKKYYLSYIGAIEEFHEHKVDTYQFLDVSKYDIFEKIENFRTDKNLPLNYVKATYLWVGQVWYPRLHQPICWSGADIKLINLYDWFHRIQRLGKSLMEIDSANDFLIKNFTNREIKLRLCKNTFYKLYIFKDFWCII